MSTQAAIFLDTIVGMKKAVKRKAYDSDSDSSIDQLTNRGNKLRKKARYVHEGQLAPPSGPLVYRRTIEHAGFHRDIISRNPPLLDEDGYEVDSEDDDERAQAAIAAAAEYDPYADVRIEHLLTPLTAASDLPDHPTLAKAFVSKTLTDLTRQAGEMVQKEKASLWKIKHLLTKLSGDHTWIPCEVVETENDITFFDDDDRDRQQRGQPSKKEASRDQVPAVPSNVDVSRIEGGKTDDASLNPADGFGSEVLNRGLVAEELPEVQSIQNNKTETEAGPDTTEAGQASTEKIPEVIPRIDESVTIKEVTTEVQAEPPASYAENQTDVAEAVDGMDVEGFGEDQEDAPAPHRMRTRAQAQAASDNTATSRTRSMTPDSSNDLFVHPYFLAPRSSHPDRDFGLPQPEAEETRRVLQLYIQKQEEVCRGAQKVYDGLLKADRYRRLVMKWAKAEAHVGVNRDMSDGEDWYDKEEWGLDEDLKKGQDEEEEDAATTAKKTRTRRQ